MPFAVPRAPSHPAQGEAGRGCSPPRSPGTEGSSVRRQGCVSQHSSFTNNPNACHPGKAQPNSRAMFGFVLLVVPFHRRHAATMARGNVAQVCSNTQTQGSEHGAQSPPGLCQMHQERSPRAAVNCSELGHVCNKTSGLSVLGTRLGCSDIQAPCEPGRKTHFKQASDNPGQTRLQKAGGGRPSSMLMLPSPPQPAQTLRRARGSAGARGPGTLWQSLHPHPALLPESRGIQISGSGGYFIRFLRAPRLQGQPLPLRSTPALSAWGRGVQSPHPCSSAWHSSGQRGLLHPGRAQDQ